jgi:hypothetical protein
MRSSSVTSFASSERVPIVGRSMPRTFIHAESLAPKIGTTRMRVCCCVVITTIGSMPGNYYYRQQPTYAHHYSSREPKQNLPRSEPPRKRVRRKCLCVKNATIKARSIVLLITLLCHTADAKCAVKPTLARTVKPINIARRQKSNGRDRSTLSFEAA